VVSNDPGKQICTGCGATLAANLRYCIYCYRPLSTAAQSHAHVESARTISTTHRADPTIVFRPEVREAMQRRARRRKRLLIGGAIAVTLIIAASVSLYVVKRNAGKRAQLLKREQMAQRELRLMGDALERFRDDVGRYPTNAEGLQCLLRKPVLKPSAATPTTGEWFGPYIDSLFEVDPWGEDYVYEATKDAQGFTLYSHGPGGAIGLGGEIEVTSSTPPEF
jgi:general secretion pathway protein G